MDGGNPGPPKIVTAEDVYEVSALSADETRVFLHTGDVSKVSALSVDVDRLFLLTGDMSKVSALPVVIIKTNGSISSSSRPPCTRSVVSKASLHLAASS